MHYVTFWQNAQIVGSLEKLAASDDVSTSSEAQGLMASACDEIFSKVKQASGLLPAMMSFRESHRVTGEKLAASPEVTATLLEKLATAEYVDGVLENTLEKLSGAEYDATRAVQLLGREYAIQLMRGLLA